MTEAGAGAGTIWCVRLRYRGWFPSAGRPAVTRWVEEVLPHEGALPPVTAVATEDDVLVMLHIRSPGQRQALVTAADLVERVVGDSMRVLGLLTGAAARPRPD